MFTLLTTLYNELRSIRMQEYFECLDANLANSMISRVIIFYEGQDDANPILNILKAKDKIHLIYIDKRPTYEDFFKYANDNNIGKCILANADIFFHKERGLTLIENLDLSNTFLVLTRYQTVDSILNPFRHPGVYITDPIYGKMKTQHKNGCSIDTWIFQTPVRLDEMKTTYQMGIVGCDGRMNYQLQQSSYNVFNPCLDIITIHRHKNWSEAGYNTVRYEGKIYNRAEWDAKCYAQGDYMANIGFCKLEDIEKWNTLFS